MKLLVVNPINYNHNLIEVYSGYLQWCLLTLWALGRGGEGCYKIEENLSIQDIDDENNFINIAHESHAYDNIKEAKLEDKTISHNLLDCGDTNLFNCKLI